jgi:membrane-associated phospholipid phosphatase
MAGVHYPLDIVVGASIGVVVTYFVFKLRDLLMPVLVAVIRLARIFCLA